MDINIILIAVLMILIGSVLLGYWRGFIRIAFSLVTMILMIALVSWTTPYVTDALKNNTTVYEELSQICAQKIQEIAEENIGSQKWDEGNTNDTDGNIGQMQLPALWVEQILEKTGETVSQTMEESGLYQQAGAYVANWILNGVAFLVSLCLVAICLKLILGLLDIVAKLPVLKGLNRLLGAVVGFFQGLIFVWLLMFVIAIACTSKLGQTALQYVNDSAFLTYLYQNNGILYLIDWIFG